MEHEIRIDPEKCRRCGRCAAGCSTGFIRMRDGAPVTGGRIRCIACGHCVAACPAGAVTLDGEGAVPVPDDTLETLFMQRRSIRKFKPEPPARALIQRALDCAQYAPSGKNRHANRWTVIYGPESCRKVADSALDFCRESGQNPELLYLAEKGLDPLTGHAPLVLVGWSPDNALNPCVDTVIAMHTVQMLLEEQGLGCCWGGYLRSITNQSPSLRALLGIPDGSSMQCCMMAGWPDGERYPNIPPRPKAEALWI